MTLASRRSPDAATAYMRVRLLLINPTGGIPGGIERAAGPPRPPAPARARRRSGPVRPADPSDPERHSRLRRCARLGALALHGGDQTISREVSRRGVAVDPRPLVLHGDATRRDERATPPSVT